MTDELQKETQKLADGFQKTETSIPSEMQEHYNQLKEMNDNIENEMIRQEELKAKQRMGGRALTQQGSEKSQEEIDREEATAILKPFL